MTSEKATGAATLQKRLIRVTVALASVVAAHLV
jgi:hypothetical protein